MGRRQKLWCVIESIEKSKEVTRGIGKKYLVHLVNGTKPVWVHSKDLSSGVCACYDETQTTPKKAKAKVDRGYLVSAKSKHTLFESKSPQDPVKLSKRNSRWIIDVERWISCTNKVCFVDVPKRKTVPNIMHVFLNRYCRLLYQSGRKP